MTGTIPIGLSYAVIGLGIVGVIWAISEFITISFNDKRRGVYDYIGKTIQTTLNEVRR